MKRVTIVFIVFLTASISVSGMDMFYDKLTDAQRYDLADAYNQVADQYLELDDQQLADDYRAMAQRIFPEYDSVERPAGIVEQQPAQNTQQLPESSGTSASLYYFNKLLRGVFDENIPISLSVIAETLYLPLFDAGIDKTTIAAELKLFFEQYDLISLAPHDVFIMTSTQVNAMENDFWRLDISVKPEYADFFPEITFWEGQMGFYFKKFPEGWRLAAIEPIA